MPFNANKTSKAFKKKNSIKEQKKQSTISSPIILKQGKMFSCISDTQRKKIKGFFHNTETFYLDLYFCGQHDNAFNLLPMCGTYRLF